MQSDLVNRLQQQDTATQQALTKQQAACAALEQQHADVSKQLKEQAGAVAKQQQQQQEALAKQEKLATTLQQHAEQQVSALAKATSGLREEVDGKLSQLELLLTGRVNDTSTGKAALTDAKVAEMRCVRWCCSLVLIRSWVV